MLLCVEAGVPGLAGINKGEVTQGGGGGVGMGKVCTGGLRLQPGQEVSNPSSPRNPSPGFSSRQICPPVEN